MKVWLDWGQLAPVLERVHPLWLKISDQILNFNIKTIIGEHNYTSRMEQGLSKGKLSSSSKVYYLVKCSAPNVAG